MADWLLFILVFSLVVGAMIVRRERAGGAFLGLLFGLGMACWAAFTFSGGRLGRWIGEELTSWEEALGPLAVGVVLVLIVLTVLHLLLWLARCMTTGPRRSGTSAVVPGLDAPAGPGNDWEIFGGDSSGDCGGGTD
jgi:hypothetical protein